MASEIDQAKHPMLHKFISLIAKEVADDENQDV